MSQAGFLGFRVAFEAQPQTRAPQGFKTHKNLYTCCQPHAATFASYELSTSASRALQRRETQIATHEAPGAAASAARVPDKSKNSRTQS